MRHLPRSDQHLNLRDLIGPKPDALEADSVDAVTPCWDAEYRHESGHISNNDGSHADHDTGANLNPLPNTGADTEVRAGTDPDMAGERDGGGQRRCLLRMAVMSDIGMCHQEAVVLDAGRGESAALDDDELADDVAITDHTPFVAVLTVQARASRMSVSPMFWRGANDRMCADPVFVSETRSRRDDNIWPDDVAVPKFGTDPDDCSRMDRIGSHDVLLTTSEALLRNETSVPHAGRIRL